MKVDVSFEKSDSFGNALGFRNIITITLCSFRFQKSWENMDFAGWMKNVNKKLTNALDLCDYNISLSKKCEAHFGFISLIKLTKKKQFKIIPNVSWKNVFILNADIKDLLSCFSHICSKLSLPDIRNGEKENQNLYMQAEYKKQLR